MFRICREYRETEFLGKQSLRRAVFETPQASLGVEIPFLPYTPDTTAAPQTSGRQKRKRDPDRRSGRVLSLSASAE